MYMAQQEIDVHNYHVFIKQMIESGMPEKQAKCLIAIQIKFLNANVATKADIKDLRQELKSDIEVFRLSTQVEFEKVRKEIVEAKISIIMWMVSTNVVIGLGIAGLIIAAIKYL